MNPIFLLACDHRNSYVRALPEATPQQLTDGKVIVAQAVANVAQRQGAAAGVGLLTDPMYGQDAIALIDDGACSALAIERSGQAIFEVDGPDWLDLIDQLTPTWAKVLIRYRTDDPLDERELQQQRLLAVEADLADRSTGFLLEIITPFTDEEQAAATDDLDAVRLPILQAAIAELLDAGLNPDVWKVEGLDQADSCQTLANQCRTSNQDVGLVVLGAGAPPETVNRWLMASAAGAYNGFAVGRSIWSEPLIEWHRGDLSAADATDQIAQRYEDFINTFHNVTA